MRLLGFRIHNYRSVIDSDWTYLSPDNITGLIGQNESGKTSILEALYSFYDGKISEDVLRSDLSLPIVSCLFEISREQVNAFLKEKLLPRGVMKKIQEVRKICLSRIWNDDLSSRIILGGDEINKLYNEHKKQLKEKDNKIQSKIENALRQQKKAIESLNNANYKKEKVAHAFEDQKGFVLSVNVIKEESSADDYCLYDAAKTAALRSKFNASLSAPIRQKGTLTYHFVAQ